MVVVVSIAVLQVCMSSKQRWLVFLTCWLCGSAFGCLLVPLATGETPNQDQSFLRAMKSAFDASCVHFCILKVPITATTTHIFDTGATSTSAHTFAIPPDYALCSLIAMLTIRLCCGALSSRLAQASSAPQSGARV